MTRAVVPGPERLVAPDDVVDALLEGARRLSARPRAPERMDPGDGSAQHPEPDCEGGERDRVRHHPGAHQRCVNAA
jgi:hypothetical protein